MSSALSTNPLAGLTRFSASRRLLEAHALPAYGLCFLGMVIIAATIASGAFDYDRALFLSAAWCAGFVLLFAFAARWIGFSRIADPVEQIMLLYLTGLTFAFCSAIFASTAAPMADAALRRADMMLFGVDRVRFIADMKLTDGAIRFWALIYNSLAVSPSLAMILLVWTGKAQRAWTLLTALLATALVSILFVLVLPAFGTPPFPYEFVDVFKGLRDGSMRTLGIPVVTGMITFPSMHAADAAILICAFSWLGRWAIPLVVLNVLMIASAVMVGGHYVVDLFAGAAIGLVILYGSLRLHGHLAKRSQSVGERP